VASEKQIAANRANALRSTGPRTAVGKRRSSRNAFRHGLSCPLSLGTEDATKLAAIAQAVAGEGAGEARLLSAAEFAQVQLEVLQIRARRTELIAKIDLGQCNMQELRRLTALDRYERYARTRRRRASDRFEVGIGTLGGDVGAVERLMRGGRNAR
jgi:hypothetical protein